METPAIFGGKAMAWSKCLLIGVLYAAILLAGISRHELWLDEAHHFLLALWSNSIPQLLFNARYDGHPILWNVLLFFITRFSGNPFYMQVLNVFISAAAVIIFLRKAPFSLAFKLFFIAGYFMIYEYGIISRNYALSCLLLFVALSLYPQRAQNKIAYAVSLALLANTHLFATVIAIALLVQMVWENIKTRNQQIILPAAVVAFGIALALYQAVPPADGFLYKFAPPFADESGKVLSMPFRAFFYLPDLTDYYSWNTNFFTAHYWNLCRWFFILPALIGLILFWWKPAALFTFFAAGIGIMVLAFFTLSYSIRHCGFIYMCFIAALWISYYEKQQAVNGRITKFSQPFASVLIWTVLILHVISGSMMYAKDFIQPFSESKEVSNFLAKNSLNNQFIMVGNQNIAPPVSAYLHRKLYHAGMNREVSFRYWNDSNYNISDSLLIAKVNEQLNTHDTIILLLDHELNAQNDSGKISELAKFDRAFLKSENYFVYMAKKQE